MNSITHVTKVTGSARAFFSPFRSRIAGVLGVVLLSSSLVLAAIHAGTPIDIAPPSGRQGDASDSTLVISPNPTSGSMTVTQGYEVAIYELTIKDGSSNTVFTATVSPPQTVDPDLSPGLYHFIFATSLGLKTHLVKINP